MNGFNAIENSSGKPIALIADTVKGKGVSFMEGQAVWHNRMPDDALILKAKEDLEFNSIKG